MTRSFTRYVPVMLGACLLASCAQLKSEASSGRRVFFVNPDDGDKVSSPVKVEAGVQGLKVEPQGALSSNAGHHHVFIDVDRLPEQGAIIPVDAQHVHLNDGASSIELKLSPGEHRLTLQFGDGYERSLGPELSTTITVTVKASSGDGDGAGDGDVTPGDGDSTGDGDTMPGDGDSTGDGDMTPGDGDSTGDGDVPGDGDAPIDAGTGGDGDVDPPPFDAGTGGDGDGDGDGVCASPAWSSGQNYAAGDQVTATCTAEIVGTVCYGKMGTKFAFKCSNIQYCSTLAPGGDAAGWWSAWDSLGTCP